jgi:hypothetical protein
MHNDFYTKAVLTIIAVALSIIALNPWIVPTRVEAATSQEGRCRYGHPGCGDADCEWVVPKC